MSDRPESPADLAARLRKASSQIIADMRGENPTLETMIVGPALEVRAVADELDRLSRLRGAGTAELDAKWERCDGCGYIVIKQRGRDADR